MYIGNSSILQQFAPAIDYFSGTGSATQFTLSRTVGSTIQVQVVIENVVQNPSSAYTIVGQTITFASAPPSGTNNIYVTYIAPTTQVTTLPQNPSISGSVTASGGYYAIGGFTGIYTDGSVLDYATGLGRLSVGAGDAFAFYNGGPAGTENMRIDASGNLGIGTSSPDSKFTIKNPNVSGSQTVMTVLGATTAVDLFALTVNQTTDVVALGTNYSGAFALNTNSTERMRISAAGLVGINTSTLSDQFTVLGNIRTTDGTNYAQFVNNYIRSYASGTFYFDNATVGQSFVTRVSNASALDTTAVTIAPTGTLQLNAAAGNILNSNGRPMLKQTGGILQVVTASVNARYSSSSASFAGVGPTLTITPSSTSSRIFLFCSLSIQMNAYTYFTFMRNGTNVSGGNGIFTDSFAQNKSWTNTSYNFVDSPGTTSAISYQIGLATSSSTVYLNDNSGSNLNQLIAMEIAG